MKITTTQLRQIIKEEVQRALKEGMFSKSMFDILKTVNSNVWTKNKFSGDKDWPKFVEAVDKELKFQDVNKADTLKDSKNLIQKLVANNFQSLAKAMRKLGYL
ncbi:MAG: hypothetical protein WC306_03780 [Candidatus Paceibacterota bacterium]|jgi:hypothetical protein